MEETVRQVGYLPQNNTHLAALCLSRPYIKTRAPNLYSSIPVRTFNKNVLHVPDVRLMFYGT